MSATDPLKRKDFESRPFPTQQFEQQCAAADIGNLLLWLCQTDNPYHHNVIRAEIQKQQLSSIIHSSNNLEKLTSRLIWLTVILSLLTAVLVLDVGNRFREEYFSPTLPPSTGPFLQTRA
jgi:hypothetical protein